MTQPPNTLLVLARFKYVDPKTGTEFTVDRGWPCRDQTHAEYIVKNHGHKTGSWGAECKLEEIPDAQTKSTQRTTTTKEENKKKSTA